MIVPVTVELSHSVGNRCRRRGCPRFCDISQRSTDDQPSNGSSCDSQILASRDVAFLRTWTLNSLILGDKTAGMYLTLTVSAFHLFCQLKTFLSLKHSRGYVD